MTAQSAMCSALALGVAASIAACADPRSVPGTDPSTHSTASMVTWSDGKPAISIQCDPPGGCQTRAMAMCRSANYTVLDMQNMPTRGDMTRVRGPASVVVRCS